MCVCVCVCVYVWRRSRRVVRGACFHSQGLFLRPPFYKVEMEAKGKCDKHKAPVGAHATHTHRRKTRQRMSASFQEHSRSTCPCGGQNLAGKHFILACVCMDAPSQSPLGYPDSQLLSTAVGFSLFRSDFVVVLKKFKVVNFFKFQLCDTLSACRM